MACHRHQLHQRRRREDEGAEQEITPPSSPPSRPHFFKIILSHTLESGKLGIPKSFLKIYGKDLEGLVLLKVPGGSTWPVKLEKSNNDVVWLWKGWREFMEYYSIDRGHLIVFKYEGNSIFHVIIFDKSASEIDYPLSIESDVSSPEGELISGKEENVMEIENSEGFVPCSRPKSTGSSQEFGDKVKQFGCRVELVCRGSTGPRPLSALKLASKFESDHPFFKVVMQPSYIQKSLSIPREFFREHVQKDKKIATLWYSDRSWQVKLRSYKPREIAYFSMGWSSFVSETGLRARDVCMFELIDRDNLVFRVSIFSSHGRIQIEQSQCQESSSEPAFHTSPCLSPATAHEKANKFESEHPFFNIVISPSHIKRNNVNIPWGFIKTYIREGPRRVTLVYSGRSWEVELRGYPRLYIASLTAGWSAFARGACLREGDICVFELVDGDNMVFKVSISHSG